MTKDTQSGKRSIRNSGQYASNIKKLRLEAGLTASQLAEAIGVTKNAIYNWEAGSHRPDLDTLPQLCDALMVTADELLGHSTPNLNLSEHQLLRKFRRLSSYDQMSKKSILSSHFPRIDFPEKSRYNRGKGAWDHGTF